MQVTTALLNTRMDNDLEEGEVLDSENEEEPKPVGRMLLCFRSHEVNIELFLVVWCEMDNLTRLCGIALRYV